MRSASATWDFRTQDNQGVGVQRFPFSEDATDGQLDTGQPGLASTRHLGRGLQDPCSWARIPLGTPVFRFKFLDFSMLGE